MADTDPIPVTIEVVSDDGAIRVERVMHAGTEIGRNVVCLPTPEETEHAVAVEARRDVLRAVVDPNRATPPAEDVLQAQAFLALAELDGVKSALEVAGEAIAVDVPVDPKGGVRG